MTTDATKVRPTMISSISDGFLVCHLPSNFFLTSVHMSMVKMVEAELKTEVREDIRAAIITASIRPLKPMETHYEQVIPVCGCACIYSDSSSKGL